ncbi:hypothetical protein [Streptomyces tanashiensis]|uniref:hypothetical protein n=1 Tax=Streptomyces tanashiensis TaxID=67367 RepID=UPI0033E5413B
MAPGSAMWTLDGDRTVQTTVVDVTAVKGRQAVDVVTDHMTFTAGPDLLLLTPDGWTHAGDAAGAAIAWTHAKKLCRERLTIKPGYEFGYFVGATCADGTVGKNYVSLIVNEEDFASRYASALTACTGLPARLEAVSRPSGHLKRDVHNVPFLAELAPPPESTWIKVHEVRPRPALGAKPFTFYSYRLAPYPTFLVNGHLVREPW